MKARLANIILSPHVSEKSTMTAEKNKTFAFKVLKDATKIEIKKAIESLFNVEVEKVRVLNKKRKTIGAARRVPGYRGAFKKAYVVLKEGHDIDYTKIKVVEE